MNDLKQLIAEGRSEEAWRRLYLEARDTTDYAAYQVLCRARRKLAGQSSPPVLPSHARVALLSGATISMLEEPLQLAVEASGVSCTMFASAYNTYALEMLDPGSQTVRFAPDIAVVVSTAANLPAWPDWNAGEQDVADVVDLVCEHWIGLCRSLHEHTSCEIVLANFHPLPIRPLGTAGVRTAGEPNRFLWRLNDELARRAPDYVHIHDVASLASLYGVYRWFDNRFWYLAKQPVSFDCLVPYVRNVAQIIAALRGRSAKCVVVDLDNTLWGGVVGDDGPEGLVLGEGDPVGEAYSALQRYLLRLKERGVLLAVSSKNEEQHALAPFTARPEMLLRREDFVAFHANWRPKSDNVREIAAELNIGLDAIVFVDDSPAEREQVRRALPEVRVVELSADPSDYAVSLDRTGWLDTVTISGEDRARTRMYAANAARAETASTTGDYGAFVRSLQQRAVIAPFEERHLDRIGQLTNKTNQFNLTTRRVTRSELAAMMASPSHVTAYVRLFDRFGDNGLISVFDAHGENTDLWIDMWLMSCRVFNRGVERILCNYVVQQARAAGYRTLHGLYIPTARNGLVREHYGALGFVRCGVVEGADRWILDLSAYQPLDTAIQLVDNYTADARTGNDG